MDYFYQTDINTHGAQNANQLGTVGLHIPDFRIVFSVQHQTVESYSFRLASAEETNISRGLRVDSQNTCLRVYFIFCFFSSWIKRKIHLFLVWPKLEQCDSFFPHFDQIASDFSIPTASSSGREKTKICIMLTIKA